MPRLVDSDAEDDSGAEAIPVRARPSYDNAAMRNGNESGTEENDDIDNAKVDDGADDDEEDDDDQEADEYVVKAIIGHEYDPNEKCYVYHTTWLGYDDPSSNTWEPKRNLEGALEMLQEYWERIGGDPDLKKKKRGRKSAAEAGNGNASKKARTSDSPAPSAAKRKSRGVSSNAFSNDPEDWGPGGPVTWHPPKLAKDAWENMIETVETIEPDDKGEKWAYLRWSELDDKGRHRKTKERLQHVYKAAPHVMLEFYERHLVFGKPGQS